MSWFYSEKNFTEIYFSQMTWISWSKSTKILLITYTVTKKQYVPYYKAAPISFEKKDMSRMIFLYVLQYVLAPIPFFNALFSLSPDLFRRFFLYFWERYGTVRYRYGTVRWRYRPGEQQIVPLRKPQYISTYGYFEKNFKTVRRIQNKIS